MHSLRPDKGITLVMLVVTIIVLLLLVGIVIFMTKESIIDKTVLASNKTIESFIQEQIELALAESKVSRFENQASDITRDSYFKEKLKEKLNQIEGLSQVQVNGNIDEAMKINIHYKNKEYTFFVSSNNKVYLSNSLKGNVKVGDYFYYPVEYDDVYTKKHYTASNGWRVIDDGIMPNTSGTIKLVSTGVPAKWYYEENMYETNQDAVSDLINHFANIELKSTKNANFKVDTIASKVGAMSLSDLNYAYNSMMGTNREADDVSNIEENDLFYIKEAKVYYWLATADPRDNISILSVNTGEILEYSCPIMMGIRPVIHLIDE